MEPMLAGMTVTRQHLLAWVHAHGLAALDELFCEEAGALAGAKGGHQARRTHHHWGTARRNSPSGGRRVQVRRPRVRQTTGGEATLQSVAAFRDRDPLTARMMRVPRALLQWAARRDSDESVTWWAVLWLLAPPNKDMSAFDLHVEESTLYPHSLHPN